MDDRKLIEIKKAKKVIFVEDTHGDLEARSGARSLWEILKKPKDLEIKRI